MEAFNITKFGLIFFLTLLVNIQIAMSMSISQPVPVNLKMTRGDTTIFYFYIQTVGTSVKQSCTCSVSGLDPLTIKLDEEKVTIDPGAEKKIYGSIIVPSDAPIKTYNGKLVAGCKPDLKEEESGGSLIQQTMGVDFIVDVVEKSEERLIYKIPEKEKPKASSIILILIIIVLILAITGYYFSRKKKTE